MTLLSSKVAVALNRLIQENEINQYKDNFLVEQGVTRGLPDNRPV